MTPLEELGLGSQVGDYRIVALIGQGGMGTVYRAEHVSSGNRVALKVLSDELAMSEDFRRRFRREARYARELDHPNVIHVSEVGDDRGRMYMVMPEIVGEDLLTLLSLEGPLDAQRALAILSPVADALDALHGRGIIHRDVKPANVIVASGAGPQPQGRAYLTDFGLGKDPDRDSAPLTVAGQFVGTYHHAAPEQVLGRELDYRVDIYSLGCTLYQALTGSPPFVRESRVEVLDAHIEDPPPNVTASRPELPTAIDDVILRAMAKNPNERYGAAMDLIDAARAALGVEKPATAPGDARPEKLHLRVTAGAALGTEIHVTDELVIGRHSEGAGNLAGDAEISRRHARIWRAEDAFMIEDLGSTNGTSVSGTTIDLPHALAEGDTIELGGSTLVVEAVSAAQNGEAAMPAPPAAKLQPPTARQTEISLMEPVRPDPEHREVEASGMEPVRPDPEHREVEASGMEPVRPDPEHRETEASGMEPVRPDPESRETEASAVEPVRPDPQKRAKEPQTPKVEVASGPVSLHLEIDFDAREARVSVGEDGTAVRLVERDGRWVVEPS
jgi:pSer/pThr/pTyr-binding forkhead associated (FHA) protein